MRSAKAIPTYMYGTNRDSKPPPNSLVIKHVAINSTISHMDITIMNGTYIN